MLGPYELLSPLGAGGMGEVYRARDTRLNREAAIKILPVSFANDADRLLRFEQEARATSALNNANILTVYDIGTQEGLPFIVAELLEGEELRQQLNNGPLPSRKAIDYAQQIASGLAAAHSKGIVHRDLKPENIFITTEGRVKILDFGLAKLRPQQSGHSESDVATQRAITDPGVALGTVGYMSPEQVRGQMADHRSDIFSFGVILYEMLTGRQAFRRETTAETMTAILKEEPEEVTELNSKVAPQLERIVQRCLEKKTERRFQSTSDLCFALETLTTASGVQSGGATTIVVRGKNRERLAWIVAGVLLGLVAMLPFAIAYFRRPPVDVSATRFIIPPAAKQVFASPTISPDGRRLVYGVLSEGKWQLWIRPLDSLTAQPLPGAEGADWAVWSPDSRSIGFYAEGKIKRLDLSGGPAQPLADANTPWGIAWGRNGVIAFCPTPGGSPLYRVSDKGGEPIQLTTLNESRQEMSHLFPVFLPDGRHFLYLARSRQKENNAIYVGSLDSKEVTRISSADSYLAYSAPGYLLFAREATLMAQRFDADKLQATGEAFPVVEHLRPWDFSVSENGVLVYITGNPVLNQLTWFDRGGKPVDTVGPPGHYFFPRLSPDEKRVAVVCSNPASGWNSDIWQIDQRGVPSPLTSDPAFDTDPVWSPDGSRIAFDSDREGVWSLYQKLSSGAGNDEELLKGDEVMDWSPDGRFILYGILRGTFFEPWVLPMFGDRKPYQLLQTELIDYGTFSPNGRWVAYESDETGTVEVYVREFQGSGGKWRVSTGGGSLPRWRRDGKELFYLSGGKHLFYLSEGKMMAVEVKASGASFEAGVPKLLFERGRDFDVSRDGQRFLIPVPVEEGSSAPITVVMNWTADLKR